jgi:hypothetical protein
MVPVALHRDGREGVPCITMDGTEGAAWRCESEWSVADNWRG